MREANQPNQPVRLQGIAAAPGLASGETFTWRKLAVDIPSYTIQDPEAEIERLAAARAAAGVEIDALRLKVEREVGSEEAAVFEAHSMFLDDSSLLEATESRIRNHLNAEAAWMQAIEKAAGELAQIPDPTLSARAVDVRDVGRRVLNHLLGHIGPAAPVLTRPMVLIAADLEPSETAAMDKSKVLAFCTAGGGPTSHTAILAKAMGLPAVVGLGERLLEIPSGTQVLVDGTNGVVIANPTRADLQAFGSQRDQAKRLSQEELAHAVEPASTRDGKQVEVVANVGGAAEAASALNLGAEGIGLLRTEFLYLERDTAPDEEEQYAAYCAVLDAMETRPVVVRTLDVGGDKQLAYLDLGKEANPFLGWRAIRMCLDRPDFFKVQLRALLRSSPGHNLRIMLPMISTLDEVHQSRKLLAEARQEVEALGFQVAGSIQLGIMVEIPSVAVMADRFASQVDFFSIGTNDLTQYTFAAERTNEKVAHLGDAIHPAILRQINQVIDAAHASRIWVGVCGELAGDPQAIPILLGLGLDEFSMAPASIPHAKAVLRSWTYEQARLLAHRAMSLDSAQAVRKLVHEWDL